MTTMEQLPDDFLDDFMSRAPVPVPKKVQVAQAAQREVRIVPFVEPPPVFDAVVLFHREITCKGCGERSEYPMYFGVRKRVKGGYAYLSYAPSMAELVAHLPRYYKILREEAPMCLMCYDGAFLPDDGLPEKFFHASRTNSHEDVRLFASTAAGIDLRVEGDVGQTGKQTG